MNSLVYDGGGTDNALQVAADLDAVIALGTQPTAIATGNHTGIELFMVGADADKTPVVVCINHETAAVALGNIVHIQEDSVSASDMAFSVDRSVWDLAVATDHEPKRLIYFPCAPDSYVSIVLQDADTSTWYTRYRLTQMHTAAAGGVGAAEGDAATAGKQDTGNTSLAAIQADTNELTAAPVAKTWVTVTKALTTPNTAEEFVASQTFCTQFHITAKEDAAANTGSVFIGDSNVDAATNQQHELTAGATMSIVARAGTKIDLFLWWFDATNAGDSIVLSYEPV